MIPAWLAFFDGLLGLALVGAGMAGSHFDFVAPFAGFQMFVVGFFLSFVGLILGIIGLFRTRAPERRAVRPRAVVGTIFSLAVFLPVTALIIAGRQYPPINDITTDADNPPEFVAVIKLPDNAGRDMKYDKAKYFARQTAGYGDLQPLKLSDDPATALAKVKVTAAEYPNWQIVSGDPTTMTLEGVSTSSLFHFHDDFIIQVRPGDGGGSLIEMRSKSRVGIGDFGMNYKRIQAFFDRLKSGQS